MSTVIHSAICSFTRTAHSFACSALLASLARSAALIRSLARSLAHSGAHGKAIYVYGMNASISYNLKPLCNPRAFFPFPEFSSQSRRNFQRASDFWPSLQTRSHFWQHKWKNFSKTAFHRINIQILVSFIAIFWHLSIYRYPSIIPSLFLFGSVFLSFFPLDHSVWKCISNVMMMSQMDRRIRLLT